jgi:hypothetical protein
MNKTFRWLLFTFSALLISSSLFAQQMTSKYAEAGPTAYQKAQFNYSNATEAIWDLLFTFSAGTASGALGNAGAETDGTFFYTTRWATNLIHKYDQSGNLVEEFSITGVSGTRDLAYDGTYFYGGAAGTTINQMDFVTKTFIGSFASTQAVRHISYDEGADAFWVGNWSTPVVLINRSGSEVASFAAPTAVTSLYGSAYDGVSSGGPYIWLFGQSGSGAELHQYTVPGGTATGIFRDVLTDVGAAGDIAGGAFTYDNLAGQYVLGGLLQGGNLTAPDDIVFGYEIATTGPPVGPGPATNPSPASGATDLPITGNTATWDNPAGATYNQVYFSDNATLVATLDPAALVLDGSPSTVYASAPLPALMYSTSYYWRIVEWDGTGSTNSPVWSFTTMADPSIVDIYVEDFESGAPGWAIIDNGGTCTWAYEPVGLPYTMPATASGTLAAANSDACGSSTTMNTTLEMTVGVDLSQVTGTFLEYDSDFNFLGSTGEQGTVEWSADGGTTWNVLFTYTTDVRSETAFFDISAAADGQPDFRVRFVYVAPGWDWWWALDNVTFGGSIVPVELTSFTYDVSGGNVVLNWSTATETNNSHFNIERSDDNVNFTTIGSIEGKGTTSETSTYSYVDNTVNAGVYYYRLKQVDFDGTFEFSSSIEVDLGVPSEYSIEQNYPNPFNPATTIKFAIPVDAKVSITLYNSIGQQVAQVVNQDFSVGIHEVNFTATNLSSGVYFYSVKAVGVDGSDFVATKKMMLMK